VRNFHRFVPACKRSAGTASSGLEQALRRDRGIADRVVNLLQLL